jgi:hypothetical protein
MWPTSGAPEVVQCQRGTVNTTTLELISTRGFDANMIAAATRSHNVQVWNKAFGKLGAIWPMSSALTGERLDGHSRPVALCAQWRTIRDTYRNFPDHVPRNTCEFLDAFRVLPCISSQNNNLFSTKCGSQIENQLHSKVLRLLASWDSK